MAGKTVTTITELVNALEDTEYWTSESGGGTITVAPPNGVLDFNNEGYFYKQTPFLNLPVNASYTDSLGNIQYHDVIIDFNNTKLTNMYIYPENSFMILDSYSQEPFNTSHDQQYTFINGEFEIVINNGYFLRFFKHGRYNDYSNAAYGQLIFKNCIFNIKVTNKHVSFLFDIICGKTYFINCVFNIEYVNMTSDNNTNNRPSVINVILPQYRTELDAYNHVYILSNEFRIRFRPGCKPMICDSKYIKQVYGFNILAIECKYKEITDNVIFINKYFTDYACVGIARLMGGTAGSYSNNFIASFGNDEFNTNESLKIVDHMPTLIPGAKLFFDNTKIGPQASSVWQTSTLIGLPTADCKNAEKLIEAGYIFASET
jgi:hypothetical protein